MEKVELLQQINFGERIAEEEVDTLVKYFVATEGWRLLFEDRIDIIYGTKGSGKSALYSILEKNKGDLLDKNIILTTAENPRGNTVFEGLVSDPPTTEIEFIRLWKLYFLIITFSVFDSVGLDSKKFLEIKSILQDANLIPYQPGLKAILKICRDYIRKWMEVESVQPEVGLNEGTGMPNSVNFKVSFREPSLNEIKLGVQSIESLYEKLQEALNQESFSLWIAVDRLDVAFSENIELETNALRALFRVYRDLVRYNNIKLKIFLRNDIWDRIVESGFREASHVTKTITISWTKETVVNLILRRLLNNEVIVKEFNIDKTSVLSDYSLQEKLFYKFFPEQVDVGDKRPKTIEWILGRVRDGNGIFAPREIIHLLNEGKLEQIKRLQIGQSDLESDNLIGRNAFKAALRTVSQVRLEQTIYAEYPTLKSWIQKLHGEKTEQRLETLAEIWSLTPEECLVKAKKLVNIGFFEEKGEKNDPRFWVPFLYRNQLEMIQGTADL